MTLTFPVTWHIVCWTWTSYQYDLVSTPSVGVPNNLYPN